MFRRHLTYSLLFLSIALLSAPTPSQAGDVTDPVVKALAQGDHARACQLQLAEAQRGECCNEFAVGACYQAGTGVPLDYALAANWFRKAMTEREDRRAQAHLARLMVRGLVPGGTEEGLRLAREAAEWGGAVAEMIYGSLLGEAGFQTDEAIRWLKRSAASFHPDGAYALADLYHKLGKPQDAEEWRRKGKELDEKRGTYADLVAWVASGKTRPSARDAYNRGARILAGEEKGSFEDAVALIRDAARDHIKEAEAQVGLFHLYGKGLPYDPEEAVYWLRRAALHGSPHGKHYLDEALAAAGRQQ